MALPRSSTIDDVLTPARRAELHGFCYRMLGSPFDAEDAVQETLRRAWGGYERFEGRSEVRTWLYRIASNVCFDALRGRNRRALPIDMAGPARPTDGLVGEPLPGRSFVEPIPTDLVTPPFDDPAEIVARRESIRLAFVAALQRLPPQQRAVLILREVLAWHAAEVAELLDTTVAAVNSALQRARATMAAGRSSAAPTTPADEELLVRYVDAFERYDFAALTELIKHDATQSMPPWSMWLRGRADILDWWQGPGAGCRGSALVPTSANGVAAFGQYRRQPDGTLLPWALQVVELAEGSIVNFVFYLEAEPLFALFGLPASVTEQS